MADLRLTFACGPYDRTQALRDGTIKPDGIDLTYLTMQPAEIFWRMLQYNEFHACEMSLSNTTTVMSGPNPQFIAPIEADSASPATDLYAGGEFLWHSSKGYDTTASDWQQAFDTARGGQCGKVVLDWTEI